MSPTVSSIQPLTFAAPVTTVTLLEDRAQVRRVGKASFTPGLWRLRVEGVTPVLSDKSLRADFCEKGFGRRVDDVRICRQRRLLDIDQPERLQTLLQEWRSLRTQFDQLSEDRHHLQNAIAEMDCILTKTVEELPVDATWGQLDPTLWQEQLQRLFQHLRESRQTLLTLYSDQHPLAERLNTLATRIQAVQRPDWMDQAYLEADVMVAQAGEWAIAFEYVVPNALWRPWNQARLQTTGTTPTLTLRFDGCVWQRTGEDWHEVELVFSTARPSLGSEPPLLHDDWLKVRDKARQIVVQSRNQTIQTPGLGASSASGSLDLPGVDDGGQVQVLRAARPATIPSDGRPYRVALLTVETPATLERVLMPEVTPQVVIKSTQTNPASFPILAGPVDLIYNTEFVGRSPLPFIAPGESFALGWGPDAAIRVQRTLVEEKTQNPLTRWNTLTKEVTLYLSNIGAEPCTLTLTERIPVSELEAVKVEVVADRTTPNMTTDDQGLCVWSFTLEPYSQRSLTLTYKLSAAPEVALVV